MDGYERTALDERRRALVMYQVAQWGVIPCPDTNELACNLRFVCNLSYLLDLIWMLL